jgi:hypothetical protein
MCAAFPRSDYYGGSAPRPRHRRTCRLAGLRVPGARIEVPVFVGGTLGAVGGWLYPWQRGPPTQSGRGGGVPIAGTPSHAEIATGRWLHPSLARVFAPYRGFHRHLQLRVSPPRFTLAPSVARLGAEALRGQLRPFGCCRPPVQSRRRSRSPSAPGPTRARMTSLLFRSSVPPALHGALSACKGAHRHVEHVEAHVSIGTVRRARRGRLLVFAGR